MLEKNSKWYDSLKLLACLVKSSFGALSISGEFGGTELAVFRGAVSTPRVCLNKRVDKRGKRSSNFYW